MAMKMDGIFGTGSRYGREGVGTLNRVPHLGHGTTEPALTSSIRRYWPQWRQNTEAFMVNPTEITYTVSAIPQEEALYAADRGEITP